MSKAVNQTNQVEEGLNEAEEENCKNCGQACDPYNKPSLRCSGGCNKRIHIECLKRGGVPVSFVGDVFFELNCTSCSPSGEETVVRDKMPWLSAIILTLYNLREKSSGISKRGYFHWKSDVSTFVDRNWDYLFKKTVKRKKNWIGTISGTLSHYSGIVFKSGTNELGESGWWKLLDNDPPEILIAKNNKMLRNDKKKQPGSKLSSKSLDSPAPSDSSISVGEDSNCSGELFKNKGSSIYSHAYVQPTETLSNFLLEEDEPNDMDNEDDIMLNNESEVPSISDLINDCQYGNNFHLAQMMDNCDWLYNFSSSKYTGDEVKTIEEEEEEGYDEDSSDSPVSIREQPPVSLFKEAKRRQRPWSKSFVAPNDKIPRMTYQEEAYLLQKINKTDLSRAPAAVRRLYRKLAVRKIKREYRLPLLDIDCFGSKPTSVILKDNGRVLDRFFNDNLGCVFEQRLQGYNQPTSVHSPYTNRLLKPFIRRDTSCRPLWLRIMEELLMKTNKNNPEWKPQPRASIDYSYIRPQHIPAINSLCNQFFWPDIDLTECLQYPDFTCVVLYKKLVIGFAILVPYVSYNESYISFILTRPEWQKSGIGTFMLYHLIQTCMGQDVTLHVSVTNSALILYQKFGFKVEEFIQDFYDKYMPPNSRECRHALFLRLNR